MKVGQVSMTTFKYKSWNAELKKNKKNEENRLNEKTFSVEELKSDYL